MYLYLLSQDVNNDYDTYDSCIVAAESEDEARYCRAFVARSYRCI